MTGAGPRAEPPSPRTPPPAQTGGVHVIHRSKVPKPDVIGVQSPESHPVSFCVERDGKSVIMNFVVIILWFVVPLSLLVLYLDTKIGASRIEFAEDLLITPPIAVLIAWIMSHNFARAVVGTPGGVTFVSQDRKERTVSWEDFGRPTVVGFTIGVRFPAEGLDTAYGVVFTTKEKARAILSHPSFPESKEAEIACLKLGLRRTFRTLAEA